MRVPLPAVRPEETFWQMHESEPLIDPDDQPRPVTFLLHGMCADSSWTCDWLQYFALSPQWQLCPRAPRKCREEGYNWTRSAETLRLVELSLATAKDRQKGRILDDSIVVAGFSLGAYAAAALVHELARKPVAPIKLAGVVAQGAHVHFYPTDLRKLKLRVALTAGDLDAAAPDMRAEADRLRREGIDARFVSLGKDESHFSSVSTGKTIAQLVDWCRSE